MANFRVYQGMWLRFMEDRQDAKKGEIYQVLKAPSLANGSIFTFVGLKGVFTNVAKYVEPVYYEENGKEKAPNK